MSNRDLLERYVGLVNVSRINYTLSFVSNKNHIVGYGRGDVDSVLPVDGSDIEVSNLLEVNVLSTFTPGILGQTVRNYTPDVWRNNNEVGLLDLYLPSYLLLDSINGIEECPVIGLLGLVSYLIGSLVLPGSGVSNTLLSLDKVIEYLSVNLLLDEGRTILVYLVFEVNKSTKFLLLVFKLLVSPTSSEFSCNLVYGEVGNLKSESRNILVDLKLCTGSCNQVDGDLLGSGVGYSNSSFLVINRLGPSITSYSSINLGVSFSTDSYRHTTLNELLEFGEVEVDSLTSTLWNLNILYGELSRKSEIVTREEVGSTKTEVRNLLILYNNLLHLNDLHRSAHWLNGNDVVLYEFWEEFLGKSKYSLNYRLYIS